MQSDQGLGAQIQHQVKRLGQFLRLAAEINRAGHLADGHAVPVRGALVAVNLVTQINRTFGANGHAGIAACTQVEIDRVAFCPLCFKSTEPALEAKATAANNRILALLHGKAIGWITRNALRKNSDIERIGHQCCYLLGLVQRAHNEQAAVALISDG